MDHVGYDDNGTLGSTVDFQYPDDGEAVALESAGTDAVRFASILLNWIAEPDSWRTQKIRHCAVSYVLDANPGMRMREYAQMVRTSSEAPGVTRAAISAAATEFCDKFGIHKPTMKTGTARQNMAQARLRVASEGAQGTRRKGPRALCGVLFLLRRVLKDKGTTDQGIAELLSVRRATVLEWAQGKHVPTGIQAARIRQLAERYPGEIAKAKADLHREPKALLQYQLLTALPSEPQPGSLN